MVVLSGITHNKKEALREYIDLFRKLEVEVGGTYNKIKCWIFNKGLRSNYMF